MWRSLILAALLGSILSAQSDLPALDAVAFKKIHPTIRVNAGAKWLQIPWQTDILKARAAAALSKKPIFLWAMNGHPLGCT